MGGSVHRTRGPNLVVFCIQTIVRIHPKSLLILLNQWKIKSVTFQAMKSNYNS